MIFHCKKFDDTSENIFSVLTKQDDYLNLIPVNEINMGNIYGSAYFHSPCGNKGNHGSFLFPQGVKYFFFNMNYLLTFCSFQHYEMFGKII